ncbi:MAG: LytTR family transcriptional regulator [Bacilli bacterium]|nr:LytTR family transcriptional regulator [Bacilli bacterium]
MINFIIYDDVVNKDNIYKRFIAKFMGPQNYSYRFKLFQQYNKDSLESIKNLSGKTMFILAKNIDVDKSMDFAKDIRNNSFINNPIIICNDTIKTTKLNEISNILFINTNESLFSQLKQAFHYAYKIFNYDKSYVFKVDNEIYQIPFEQILYFEKNLNDNSTFLVTNENYFILNKSISSIDEDLKDECNFLKTHRSCIVNLDNIQSINFTTNVIKFNNCKTDLISRNKKKILKELFTLHSN